MKWAPLFLVALCAGCGGGNSIQGTWTVTMPKLSQNPEIETFSPDGTFTEQILGPNLKVVYKGRYTLVGNRLTTIQKSVDVESTDPKLKEQMVAKAKNIRMVTMNLDLAWKDEDTVKARWTESGESIDVNFARVK